MSSDEEEEDEFNTFCPECEDIPDIMIYHDLKSLIIICECGYYSEMDVEDYINHFDVNTKVNYKKYKCGLHNNEAEYYCLDEKAYNCEECYNMEEHADLHQIYKLDMKLSLNDIKFKITQANRLINEYFLRIKMINSNNKNKDLVDKLNKAYDKCYTLNKNALKLIELFVANYNNDNYYMYNNIIQNSMINLCKCKDEHNITVVIDYFNTFLILSNIVKEKVIDYDYLGYVSAVLLNDGRLAIGDCDNKIKIYQLQSKDRELEIDNEELAKCLCKLENGNIAANGKNRSINIYSISEKTITKIKTIIDVHKEEIINLISISNNQIASIGENECIIKIWNISSNQVPIVLEGHSYHVNCIGLMKEKDILLSDDENNNLFIWNLKTFQCENKFFDIECIKGECPIYETHTIYQIDNERVIIGGSSVCTIINIAKSEIEDCIVIEGTNKENVFHCFMKLNEEYLLIGMNEGMYCRYNLKTKEYNLMRSYHNDYFSDMIKIDEKYFVSYGNDIIVNKY